MSHQNNQSAANDVLNAAQTSQSDEAVIGKLKLVETPPAIDHCQLTPEPEATELRELIRTLQACQPKNEVEPKREDTLPPAA